MFPGWIPTPAADIVAKAIIERPRTIAPWWLWPAEVAHGAAAVTRGACDAGVVAARHTIPVRAGRSTDDRRLGSDGFSGIAALSTADTAGARGTPAGGS